VDPLPKSIYKENILTHICAYYERLLRQDASRNEISGLRGRHHPALANIITTTEVQKSRLHLKMLAGDFYTYEVKSDQSGGSPHCRYCEDPSKPVETLCHILSTCSAYSDIRERISVEYQQNLQHIKI
jgi:hypothetical protein